MNAAPGVKRPSVLGIAGLSLLRGVLSLLAVFAIGFGNLSGLGIIVAVLAVAALVTGVLLFMYKRIGLYLGAVVFGLDLVLGLVGLAGGSGLSSTGIIGLIIDAAALYYIYLYLTKEPQKSFFT